MKKLFVYGAFLLALSACKNDKTTTKTDDKTTTPTTTGTDKTTTPVTPSTDEDKTTGTTGGGWSDLERNTFLKTCTDAAAASMGREKATDYCSCMGEKVEKMHPNSTEAGSMTQEEMTELAKECLK